MLSLYSGMVCLNPCFSGTYSRSTYALEFMIWTESLNPCFSGTYSRSIFLLLFFYNY